MPIRIAKPTTENASTNQRCVPVSKGEAAVGKLVGVGVAGGEEEDHNKVTEVAVEDCSGDFADVVELALELRFREVVNAEGVAGYADEV